MMDKYQQYVSIRVNTYPFNSPEQLNYYEEPVSRGRLNRARVAAFCGPISVKGGARDRIEGAGTTV